jgi:hypothetical protein
MGEKKNACAYLVEKPERKILLRVHGHRCEDDIKMDL